jgi:hypothetical protein
MIRTLFVVALSCAACGACSSSTADTVGGAGSNGNGSCPDVSGAWEITDHCDSSFIGSTLQVTQRSCALSFEAPFDGFSGSVTPDEKITLSGPQSCTGTASTESTKPRRQIRRN